MASVLVTGGSGLIGWRCVERLLAEGHEVTTYELAPNLQNLAAFEGQVAVVQGDVADLPKLLATMKGRRVTHVLHLAAYITEFARLDPAGAFRTNTLGSANVFDAARALDVARVVWTSSVTALAVPSDYDNTPVPDDHHLITAEPYGASKYGAEVIATHYRRLYGQDIIAIRPALTYGLGRLGSGAGLFNEAIRRLALGEPVGLLGAKTLHQPMYNRDMAKLLVGALFGEAAQRAVFNVPVDRNYTDDELVAALRRLSPGSDITVSPLPDYIPKVPVVDGSAAREHFRFQADFTLEAAVAEMIEVFRAQAGA